MTSSTDPDGQTITYTYNTNAQLTAENLPDGTSDTYTYDSLGNMLTADGPGGELVVQLQQPELADHDHRA